MSSEAVKKQKLLRIGFYTSSDGSKKGDRPQAANAFGALYEKCTSELNSSHRVEFDDKKLKITFLEKNTENNYYFGFMSCSRNGAHLAYIGDEDWIEEKIPLTSKKYLVERTYFLYYEQADLLVLTQNNLGPKPKDLGFILFNSSDGLCPVAFEAIWRKESVKELLETGSTLRSCDLVMAIPRNFNATNYDLTGTFSKQLMAMIAGSGSAHIHVKLRGQAPIKGTELEWLSQDVKASIKELMERFTPGSGGVDMQKVDVVEKGNRRKKSLIDQVLISSKMIKAQSDGYPEDTDVRSAMIQAKIENSNYLVQYDISHKPKS